MLGAIIRDIVGSRWEFDPTNDYNFEMFSDENSFTDDTVCTIAVADAIIIPSNNNGSTGKCQDTKDLGIFLHFQEKDLGICRHFREKDLGIFVFSLYYSTKYESHELG